jgi:hypothetical protein
VPPVEKPVPEAEVEAEPPAAEAPLPEAAIVEGECPS